MLTTDICRICLNKNVPMFILNNTLQNLFETLINGYIRSDVKPVLACFICFAKLKRCRRLQLQAIKSNELLNKISVDGNELPELIDTQRVNQDYLQFTPIYHIHLEEINIEDKPKIDVIPTLVKNEIENVLEDRIDQDSATELNFDTFQNTVSDSEDDIPLIAIGNKKIKETPKINKKRQKRDNKDFKVDAKEIDLTEEEQRQELLQRASSDNYLNSPYKCEKCYKGFVDPQAFSNHKEKHDKRSGPYECTICQLRYTSARQLRAHSVSAHSRRYSCSKCPHRSHTRHQAKDHEKWHNGFTYPCRVCGQKFQKPTSFLTHMRKNHSEHVCVRCGDSFVGKHGLLMHLSKTHKRDEEKDNSEVTAMKRFCSECNIQFLNLNAWKKHILTSFKHMRNGNSMCDICGVSVTSESRGSHMRSHMRELRPPAAAPAEASTPTLRCSQCESQFTSRSRLQAHVRRVHLGLKYDKNVVCEMCGKKCTSAASLRYHQRAHTGERPYACALCPASFAQRAPLRVHARTHSGERPYACHTCGKRFTQKPALNRHYRVHSGARPYSCTQCTKCFSQSNSLKLHIRTVHLKLPLRKKENQQ
ncbi:PREDICTED: zinc finger protein 25-like [Papilio polytes]|uniref:zinc finger protein 25-like n=1 Tax=Papilio polytes TaxID=76194 RepID=UPI000676AB60|nr:PREDICTED: zinc finger protein 25-like [Papilio polytes]